MFSASAELYDLIYSGFKDYPAEAAQVAALIRGAHPGAHRVLDVACGTGEHARLLTSEHGFTVDGLDLDPAFVRIAREKLPDGEVYEGDMTSFELPRRYDAVLCLFSSIGYVRTLEGGVRRARALPRAHGGGRGDDLHELGLFTVDEMLAAFRHAGLRADYQPGGPAGRGLYLARL